MYSCTPDGVCAKQIDFDVEDGKLSKVHFTGGCLGNLEAVSRLVEGMDVDKVIDVLSGIRCGKKPTSCTDQLCLALADIREGKTDKYTAIPKGPVALKPLM